MINKAVFSVIITCVTSYIGMTHSVSDSVFHSIPHVQIKKCSSFYSITNRNKS